MGAQTLAFEIGTEEIPAFDLKAATKQLAKLVPDTLGAAQIPHGEVSTFGTPRRLIAIVNDVPASTEAVNEEFKGPKAEIAFDADGKPTKAGEGFARGKGISASELEVREVGGVSYVFACVSTPSKNTADLLPEVFQKVIEGISWPKSMRWGTTNEHFSRPIRWLFAMLGDEVVPFEYAGLRAGAQTYGHRFLARGPHDVASADSLLQTLEDAFVVVSEDAREKVIRDTVAKIEQKLGLKAELPAKTLTEVVNLSEYPTVMLGSFDEEFLQVPEEIIVDAMLKHQRYFPLYDAQGDAQSDAQRGVQSGAHSDAQGNLSNKFIIVSNGNPECESIIVDGNERVVAARLYDAKFFYEEDLKEPLESYVERLSEVVFQEDLGTMYEKTQRTVELVKFMSKEAGLAQDEATDAIRAAELMKADLVTNAVIEFTSTQGIMGSYYAAASGENARVAQAIADHYRPRFAGDELPQSQVGRIVAIADKLDSICGLFAIGQTPTGSSDPFALRRAAIGIIAMLEAGVSISLESSIDESLKTYSNAGIEFDATAAKSQIADFFIGRTKVILRERGLSADAIEAVLATGVVEPTQIMNRVRALELARSENPELFDDLATAFARANNLRDEKAGCDFSEEKFCEDELSLSRAIKTARMRVEEALKADDFASALTELSLLREPIDVFFENVMVMDEDLAVRENRMKLLNAFVSIFENVADFSHMARK